MYINTDAIFSMTQANQNFSAVAKAADREGHVVVFKNNRPRYLIIDMDANDFASELTEDEKIDIVAKRILTKYIGAFKELAK